jgi:DNA-binding transcriptional regulator YiaG
MPRGFRKFRKRSDSWAPLDCFLAWASPHNVSIPLTEYSSHGILHQNDESEEQRMMRMAKNFKTLREKMSPQSRERSRALAAKYRAGMPLNELREALAITQVHLARILRVNQAAVSKMERRTDMYVSTLQDFIKAMGGELKITAKFPDGTVEISQFADARKAAAGKG